MKEFVFLLVFFVIFSIVSFQFRKFSLRAKFHIFILMVVIYLIATYYIFELANQVQYILRDRGIFLEFGHASILLLEVLFFCSIISIINIISVFYIKIKKNKK
jgi:hypothetical protein